MEEPISQDDLTPISQADLLWKDLFTEFDSEAILFFFGRKLYKSIDFSVPPEYLEQEFNATFAANEPSKKIADKIIRYRLKNGQDKYIIIHVEFQGQSEEDFALRMYTYFVYIFIKFNNTDVTAVALFTGASRPIGYNCFKVSNFGTTMTYKFNTYTVREQNEAQLLRSNNPFALAVLASLYMIKAGQNDYKKLEYKKKLIEISILKKFDRAKLFRMFNFVEHLVTLPPNLQELFKNSISHTKIQEKMQAERSFLKTYEFFFGKALKEEREEGIEEGIEKGMEKSIINLHNNMGFNAEQIAKMMSYDEAFVQRVLDKLEHNE